MKLAPAGRILTPVKRRTPKRTRKPKEDKKDG